MFNRYLAVYALITAIASSTAVAAEPDLDKLRAALGGAAPDSVAPLPVPGLYEVILGSQIIYLGEDGRYVIQGEVIDLDTAVNLTEEKRKGLRLAAVEELGEENMVIFAPQDSAKHTVSIFTDVDCGYCRKMHGEMQSYLDQGIRIRYLAFPRAGVGSESYDKAVSVWCSDNPQQAMTRAKRGEELEKNTCINPVEAEYKLGIQLGVQGTPSIVTGTGEMIPGYVPADRLAQMLDDSLR